MCAVVDKHEDLGSDGADEHEAAAVEERAQPDADLGVLLLVVDVPGLGAAVNNVNDQDKLHEVGDGEAAKDDDLGVSKAAKEDGKMALAKLQRMMALAMAMLPRMKVSAVVKLAMSLRTMMMT